MKKLFIGLFIVLYQLPAIAENDFPPPFTANYSLSIRGVQIAEGSRTLRQEKGDIWKFSSTSHTIGLMSYVRKTRIDETTTFKLLAGKIQPQAYFYQQMNGSKIKKVEISFDWNKNIIYGSDNNGQWEVPLEVGILDKLLYQLIVMQDLQQGKRNLKYKVVDKGKVKTYIPNFMGKESIKTGQGSLETLKYQKVASDGERSTTLWCAPKLHFLPVQVEHDEKGELITLLLETVTGLN